MENKMENIDLYNLLKTACEEESPVKLEIDGKFDQYFCLIREIGDNYVRIENHISSEIIQLDNITDILI